ncbi:hypothetical protein N806_32055 [Rhodococcus sp. P27]|nr:hypothetical protein N601_10425 [Rhodococcus erythropolis DN1]ERB55749.1 hypothetical protein N806_32055 [Rhodococcus sp. P27]
MSYESFESAHLQAALAAAAHSSTLLRRFTR